MTDSAPVVDLLAIRARAETPKPWPENAVPTPEQLAEWLTRCTDDERVTLCGKMLDSSERASRCFVMNHDSLQAEVEHLRRTSGEAYERGWNDAVKAALEAVDGT